MKDLLPRQIISFLAGLGFVQAGELQFFEAVLRALYHRPFHREAQHIMTYITEKSSQKELKRESGSKNKKTRKMETTEFLNLILADASQICFSVCTDEDVNKWVPVVKAVLCI